MPDFVLVFRVAVPPLFLLLRALPVDVLEDLVLVDFVDFADDDDFVGDFVEERACFGSPKTPKTTKNNKRTSEKTRFRAGKSQCSKTKNDPATFAPSASPEVPRSRLLDLRGCAHKLGGDPLDRAFAQHRRYAHQAASLNEIVENR